MIFIPQACFLYFFIEQLYLCIGINSLIAYEAANFVKICLVGHIFLNISNCYQKYLSAQREVRLQLGSYLIEFVLHCMVAYVLVYIYNQGIYGIAMVTSFDYFIRFMSLQIFIYYSRFQKNLIPLYDPECFQNLLPQLKLSLKSFMMGFWQHRSYQMYSVITIFMPSEILAAQHICIGIVSIFHVLPISLSMAYSVLVGNMIGAARVQSAHAYVKMGLISGISWGLFSATVMTVFKQFIINLFTSSEQVNQRVREAYLVVTLYILIEPLSKIMTGIITGLGKQGIASVFTLIAYWVIGIPFSLLYVFEFEGKFYAIWLGATISIVFIFICSYVIMLRTDFTHLCEEAYKRRIHELNARQI